MNGLALRPWTSIRGVLIPKAAIPCWIALAGVPILAPVSGCAGRSSPEDGTEFLSDDWTYAVEGGFAITPLTASHEIDEAAAATALFTNEFYGELQLSLPGTPLESPHQTLTLLDRAGPDAHSRLRTLRGRLYRREMLEHSELASISRDVQHRFVLVGWFEEDTSEVTKGGGYYSSGAGDAEPGTTERTVVAPLRFTKTEGRAIAAVVDLWEDQVLWRGTVKYEIQRMDGEPEEFVEELDRARASAAVRLAGQVGER